MKARFKTYLQAEDSELEAIRRRRMAELMAGQQGKVCRHCFLLLASFQSFETYLFTNFYDVTSSIDAHLS